MTLSTHKTTPNSQCSETKIASYYMNCFIVWSVQIFNFSASFMGINELNVYVVLQKVGILAFSDHISTASSTDPCYSSQLSVVNPTTRQQLEQFLDNLPQTGDANYTLAFDAAFSMFRSSSANNIGQTSKGEYVSIGNLLLALIFCF